MPGAGMVSLTFENRRLEREMADQGKPGRCLWGCSVSSESAIVDPVKGFGGVMRSHLARETSGAPGVQRSDGASTSSRSPGRLADETSVG